VGIQSDRSTIRTTTHHEILLSRLQSKNSNSDDFITILKSFSLADAYNDVQRSRAKPWDDRELDCLEGFKFWSFKFTTIS